MRVFAFVVISTLAAVALVEAHSWLGCSDYRGPVDYYDDSKCYGYPRYFEKARGASALAVVSQGYQLGVDTGYNFQSSSATCNFPMASPVSSMYSSRCPKAVYEQGATYCLAWPTKNHVAASCTNQYIPDTLMKLYRSGVNPSSDPAQSAMIEVSTYFGTHTNGQKDCLGFQRSPKFCENTDKALATGCFVVPSNLATGAYVFQWNWVFNAGTEPYLTCWDVDVVAAGAGKGGGGLIGATTVADTLDGAGTSGATCKNNWAGVSASNPTPTNPNSGGSGQSASTGTNSAAPPTVALSGDELLITRAPTTIPTAGSFDVTVSYSAQGARQITVDILHINGNTATWFGKGMYSITSTSASTGSTVITCTINTATNGVPPQDSSYVLRAWFVTAQVYSDSIASPNDPTKNQPWTQELDRQDKQVTVGSSLEYPPDDTDNGSSGGNSKGALAGGLVVMFVVLILAGVVYWKREEIKAGCPGLPCVGATAAASSDTPKAAV